MQKDNLTMNDVQDMHEKVAHYLIRSKTIEQGFQAVLRSFDEDMNFVPSAQDIMLIKAAQKYLE